MGYRQLYIWVEGKDDTRFCETVLKPLLPSRFDCVQVVPYCEWKKEKVCRFIESIASMQAEYLIIGDLDDKPGIEQAKLALLKRFPAANKDQLVITIREIESWYLAGLSEPLAERHSLIVPNPTHSVSKEHFNSLMPKRFVSRIDWMIEILANFSVPLARSRNESFNFLLEKLQITV